MKRSALLFSTCLVSTFIFSSAFADEITPITKGVKPVITVTPLRVATPIDKVGSSVTVITSDDIARSGQSQVVDVLTTVPGLSITRNGGAGSASQIKLRGSTPGQVLVLIDGVRVNDTSNVDNAFDFSSLSTDGIERIEVLRGPQSALYGSKAMGGVVNIITKKGSGPAHWTGLVEAGSYETHRENIGVSGSQNKFDYALSLSNFETNGFPRKAANLIRDDGSDSQNANARVGYQATDNLSFAVSGNYSHLDAEYDQFNANLQGLQDKEVLSGKTEARLLTFDKKLENIFSVQASNSKSVATEIGGFTPIATLEGITRSAEYQGNLSLRARDILTLGVNTEKQIAHTSDFDGSSTTTLNKSIENNSLFGQYLLGIGEDTTLTLGGRHDDNDRFGTHNTYRVTGVHHFPQTETTLHASYGTAVNNPTLFQLFYAFGGNENLKAEELKGFDFGVKQAFLNKKANIDITLFDNRYTNFIDYPVSDYINIPNVKTQGVEVAADYAILPTWRINSTYTYLLAEDESKDRVLPRRPHNTFSFGSQLDVTQELHVGGTWRYVSPQLDTQYGPQINKSYSVLDLNSSYDLNKNLALTGRIDNALNQDYQEVRTYNSTGIAGYIGLRANY
ncbi:MAG: TonB-dependent receptor [Alphaproteobacteria bacterium]|nr:TonB-dependent receptor [Alphaproteobacteria bacterium]